MLQIFLLPPPNNPTGTTQLAKNGKNSAIEIFFTIDLHDYLLKHFFLNLAHCLYSVLLSPFLLFVLLFIS